jgi:hypothetical protein
MKNNLLTEKKIEIATFFHQNQGKDFELDFLCETFSCTETLILDCVEMYTTMVKQSNQEFAKSQKSKKPMQLNLI